MSIFTSETGHGCSGFPLATCHFILHSLLMWHIVPLSPLEESLANGLTKISPKVTVTVCKDFIILKKEGLPHTLMYWSCQPKHESLIILYLLCKVSEQHVNTP